MSLITQLKEATQTGSLTIDSARKLTACDWRSAIQGLDTDIRKELESIFYFIEGYVEEVDEGFVDEDQDTELYDRIISILPKL